MNKKCFRATCLLTVAVAISSCSNDDAIDNVDNIVGESKQTISLAVANTGDNFLSTRAGRPLYSSEAKQDINKVKVVIYQLTTATLTLDGQTGGTKVTENSQLTDEVLSKNNISLYGSDEKIYAQKVFSPWMNSGVSSVYSNSAYGHGRQASWNLSSNDQIKEEGVYMAYAVGYNDDEYTAFATSSDFNTVAKDGTFSFPLSVAQNTVSTGVAPVYEVFAGSAPFIVTKKQSQDASGTTKDYFQFDVALTLHRQVAGSIGYFTNIPVKGNSDHAEKVGTKLRLVASNKSDNVVFAGFNSVYKGSPANDTENVKYFVNGYGNTATKDAKFYGSSENDAYTVYEVKLSDWFKGTTGIATVGGEIVKIDTNNDGILNANDVSGDNFVNPYEDKGLAVKDGCVLGSSFLFPFTLVADKATFQLQMLSDDDTVIRYWYVRLQKSSTATDSQIGKHATTVASDGTTTTPSTDETEENAVNYSILRNHLYNIGVKSADGSTDGDQPQDLNRETLILRVNDNWEMVHQMDID